jgi:excisionase family DNA binding protein
MKKSNIGKEINEIKELSKYEKDEPLSMNEVCRLTKLTKSTLYKLTATKQIPHYKLANGKTLIFKRSEIIDWIFKNKQEVNEKISSEKSVN